jgi:hypothetical protein
MKNIKLLILLAAAISSGVLFSFRHQDKAKLQVTNMKVESVINSVGIDVQPRFSLQPESQNKGAAQTACRIIRCASDVSTPDVGSDISQFSRKALTFNCPKIDRQISLNIYFIDISTGNQPANVVVYVKNYNYPRIGLEADSSIILDLIKERYIVIVADFGNDINAYSPYFDPDLHLLFNAVYGIKQNSILENTRLVPVQFQCYFLPAGYRIVRNLEFWDIQKHGAIGTMDHILYTYNKYIVKDFNKPFAKTFSEMVKPDNQPLTDCDYKLYMDVVYPSQTVQTVPLICNFCSNHLRSPNGNPKQMRMHFAGFLMRGYAMAYVAHCFNPLTYYYGYFGSFSLDPFDGLAANTAAIRYLRAHSTLYNINSNYIGGWGHSKGAYAVTRLSDPAHHSKTEHKIMSIGQGPSEPQPWQGYSSNIQAGYQSMGFGTMEHKYVTADYVPTIIAVGEYDPYGCWEDWPALVQTYENLDANHLALKMVGMGHTFPSGFDREMNIDRYDVCHTFFDRYLKVNQNLPPAVLYVKADNEVTIHFAPVMNVESVAAGVEIIRTADGKKVIGRWAASFKNTKFRFIPENVFITNQEYKIVVNTTVKNASNRGFDEQKVFEFTAKSNHGD